MNLDAVLQLIAVQLKADPQELIEYAREDDLGGFHWNAALATFPMGSLYGVEGQILYSIIRLRKPEVIVEIGGWAGASATHMASACKANGFGIVISVDSGVGGMPHGREIPGFIRDHIELVQDDGRHWLAAQPDQSLGLVFEDADHSTELVRDLSALAIRKLLPGGILANHDAAHDFAYVGGGQKIGSDVGLAVRNGLAAANIYFTPYLAEPSDCGLALAVAPGEWQPSTSQADTAPAEVPTVAVPKRKPRTPKAK